MKMENEKEIWRPVEGCPRYMVSSKGRVKSFTSKTHPEGKLAKITRNKKGYQIVHTTSGEKRSSGNTTTTKFVHRMVAEAFIPVPRELRRYGKKALQVDHIVPVSMGGGILNEDGTFNLRWVTPKQNSNNSLTLQNLKNAKMVMQKKVYVYDEELVQVSAFTSTSDAARILGKSQGNIASSCTGALPRYLGRIWSYEELSNMKQREELEEKMHYQWEKNRKSTLKACKKWYPKGKSQGKLWYQNHLEEMREISRKYYYDHRDKILAKKQQIREKNKQEQA